MINTFDVLDWFQGREDYEEVRWNKAIYTQPQLRKFLSTKEGGD